MCSNRPILKRSRHRRLHLYRWSTVGWARSSLTQASRVYHTSRLYNACQCCAGPTVLLAVTPHLMQCGWTLGPLQDSASSDLWSRSWERALKASLCAFLFGPALLTPGVEMSCFSSASAQTIDVSDSYLYVLYSCFLGSATFSPVKDFVMAVLLLLPLPPPPPLKTPAQPSLPLRL